MKEKPFYNLMRYPIRRKKWNPMRLLFGDITSTSSIKKWLSQQTYDTSKIKFVSIDKALNTNDK